MRSPRARLPSWRVGRQVAGQTTWLGSPARSANLRPAVTQTTRKASSHNIPLTILEVVEVVLEVVEVVEVLEEVVKVVVKVVEVVEVVEVVMSVGRASQEI